MPRIYRPVAMTYGGERGSEAASEARRPGLPRPTKKGSPKVYDDPGEAQDLVADKGSSKVYDDADMGTAGRGGKGKVPQRQPQKEEAGGRWSTVVKILCAIPLLVGAAAASPWQLNRTAPSFLHAGEKLAAPEPQEQQSAEEFQEPQGDPGDSAARQQEQARAIPPADLPPLRGLPPAQAASPAILAPPLRSAVTVGSDHQFDNLPLAKRFYARGDKHCNKLNIPETAPLLLGSGGPGLGGHINSLLWVMGMAAMNGRIPGELRMAPDRDLSTWFTGWRPDPLDKVEDCIFKKHTSGFKFTMPAATNRCPVVGSLAATKPLLALQPGAAIVDRISIRKLETRTAFWNTVAQTVPLRKNTDLQTGTETCSMRQFMERPTKVLLERLALPMSDMAPKDIVVGIHLRFGDKYIMEDRNKPGSTAKLRLGKGGDDRGLQKMLDRAHTFLAEFIKQVEAKDPEFRVRLYIASDVPHGVTDMEAKWTSRVLPLRHRAFAFHVSEKSATLNATQRRGAIADTMCDWYMMAISDVIMQPVHSQFSESASTLSARSSACTFMSKVFNANMEIKNIPGCVDALVKAM